jgi:hypothetical protein
LVTRVRAGTVTFARPFFLQKVNRELPAGSYTIETDEESLEDISTLSYRRVEIRLFVPRIEGRSDSEMWIIRPQDLDTVLATDREPARRGTPRTEASEAQPVRAQAAAPAQSSPGFAQRKAEFEQKRDDEQSRRGMRDNGPLYGAGLGIFALLFATWLANQA